MTGLAFLLSWFIHLDPGSATVPARSLVLVVHPENPVMERTLEEVRQMFKGERKHWPDGTKIVLVVRESYSRERELILDAVYQMDETRYRRFWLEKVFRGEADRPITAMSAEKVREIVSRRKGAIGYLWEDEVEAGIRVLKLAGKGAVAVDLLPGNSPSEAGGSK